MEIKNVAICGMGALGMLYGTHIIDKDGIERVHFVMDKERYDKYNQLTFYKNDRPYRMPMRDGAYDEPVDLVIVAVKYNGLNDALRVIERCVGEETIIMSVLNGITSEEIIAEKFGREHMIYTVAQGTDAVKAGERLTYKNTGELRIGSVEPCQNKNLRAVCEYFDRIKMPYKVEEDIMHRIWSKFMFNVGLNQACMVYEATYGDAADQDGEVYRVMIAAMREVIAIARCEGVDLGERELCEYVRMIGTLSPEAMPSMRQDGLARRPSEVEMFSGTVKRLARKHDILVPANDFLYKRVRDIESSYCDI